MMIEDGEYAPERRFCNSGKQAMLLFISLALPKTNKARCLWHQIGFPSTCPTKPFTVSATPACTQAAGGRRNEQSVSVRTFPNPVGSTLGLPRPCAVFGHGSRLLFIADNLKRGCGFVSWRQALCQHGRGGATKKSLKKRAKQSFPLLTLVVTIDCHHDTF